MGPAPLDKRIAAIAVDQHAIIDVGQLHELGIGRGGIAHRVRCGRLHPMHRGVYAVGHPLVSREGRWMAAVRAVGHGAVLSHRSAAMLLGLRDSSRPEADVTSPRSAHPRNGIDLHRTADLPAADVTEVDGIPCTTVERTLIDLAEILGGTACGRLLERAEMNDQFDLRGLRDAIERHRTRRGAAALRRALDRYGPTVRWTQSELERSFLRLCRCHGVPLPSMNVPVPLADGAVVIVDAVWTREGLVAELDGRKTHGTRAAFERDRHRDARLMLKGYRVVRFTWRQVTDGPAEVATTIRKLLDRNH